MKFKHSAGLSLIIAGMSLCGAGTYATESTFDDIVVSESQMQSSPWDFEVPVTYQSSRELTDLGKRNFQRLLEIDKDLAELRNDYEITDLRPVVKEGRTLVLKMKELVRFLKEVRAVNQIMIDYKDLLGFAPYVEMSTPSGAYSWKPVTGPDASTKDIQNYLDLLEKYINYASTIQIHVDTDDMKHISVAHDGVSIQGVFSLDIPSKSKLRYQERNGEGGDIHIGVAFALPKGIQQKSSMAFSNMLAYTIKIAQEVHNEYPSTISLSADNMAWKAYLRRGFVIPNPKFKDDQGTYDNNQFMYYKHYAPAEQIAARPKKLADLYEYRNMLSEELRDMDSPDHREKVREIHYDFSVNNKRNQRRQMKLLKDMGVGSPDDLVTKIIDGQKDSKREEIKTVNSEIQDLIAAINSSRLLD